MAGLREATAACREAGQACSNANGCCPGSRCIRGRCKCKEAEGRFACNGPGTRCVNTKISEQHCGNCDAPWPEHHVCQGGSCIDHCEDGERDGDETDRDCGGDRCPKCGVGKACRDNDDCQSGHCVDRVCVQCTTDAHCEPLAPLAGFCVNNACRRCFDDVNCPSDVCIDNNCEECRTNAHCPTEKPVCDRSHTCQAVPPCANGVKDGNETDKDCGGPDCPKCTSGKQCERARDCKSGRCVDKCVNCGDGKQCA